MARTIGIIAIKGGVGKTTIASSLAADLVNHYGKRVLLVDANYSAPNLGLHMDIVAPRASIHEVLMGKTRIRRAIHTRFGVDVIPGSYNYEEKINPLWLRRRLSQVKDEYDFIIVDSSPSLNDEILSTIMASDNLFVVTTPDYATLSCSLKAAKLAKDKGRPITGMILNKVREPKYEIKFDEIESVMGIPIVAKIPDDKFNTRALYSRIPVSVYNRRGKFAKEINKLGAALTENEEKKSFFGKLLGANVNKEAVNRQLLKESFYTSMIANIDEEKDLENDGEK